MNPIASEVFDIISAMGIGYKYAEHAPVETIADCAAIAEGIGAVIPKNIFLTTRNQSVFYLLLTRPEAKYRTADISKQLGVSRLSFGTSDRLSEYLQTTPGAVTPMGLIFDETRIVKLAVDSALKDVPMLGFHPCVNTMTLAMAGSDFFNVFLPALGVEPEFVEIHDFLDDGADEKED